MTEYKESKTCLKFQIKQRIAEWTEQVSMIGMHESSSKNAHIIVLSQDLQGNINLLF